MDRIANVRRCVIKDHVYARPTENRQTYGREMINRYCQLFFLFGPRLILQFPRNDCYSQINPESNKLSSVQISAD